METDAVEQAVGRHFVEHAHRYRLDGKALRVQRVLNWGGFVNRHFEVSDASRAYHLKLTDDGDVVSGLRRWRALASILEVRYRAPAIVDWIDLFDGSISGLLFRRSTGQTLDLRSSPQVVTEVVELAGRLHRDSGLERQLREHGVGGDARQSVIQHYVAHLEADLEESGARYPVSASTLEWMRYELSQVRALFERDEAFDEVPVVPIHGDLWKDNVLVKPSGEWLLLDWDDLTIGDPVVDEATLLWPLAREGVDLTPWLGGRGDEPGFVTRLRLCFRAALLDEVVDSLADWVEAEKMPEHAPRVRAEKLRVHRRALENYRRRYRSRIER